MKYLDELLRISDLENYSFNREIDFTFHDSIIFDEVPLISRINHSSILEKNYSATQVNAYLLNTAIFYANHLKLRAFHTMALEEYQKYLICITYPDVNDQETPFKFFVPNICITKAENLNYFQKASNLEFVQAVWLKESLQLLNYQSCFDIKTSSSHNDYDETTRYFLLFK